MRKATSLRTTSGVEGITSSQQMEQQGQDEDNEAPTTISGRRIREVLQKLKDAQEFMGAPRESTKEHRQPNR